MAKDTSNAADVLKCAPEIQAAAITAATMIVLKGLDNTDESASKNPSVEKKVAGQAVAILRAYAAKTSAPTT